MWVYSIAPPSLSLIGLLITTEIYDLTEKKNNWKYTQAHRLILIGLLSPYPIWGRVTILMICDRCG